MIVGHEHVQQALSSLLPTVTLIVGPDSVGKRTMAEHYIKQHGAIPADQYKPKKLDPDAARELHSFFSTAPFGPSKVALLDLDTVPSTNVALNILLKLLEEPPPLTKVVMTSTRTPLLTVMSRSTIFRCGFLSEPDLVKILQARYGMRPEDAATAARAGGGQVNRAVAAADLSTAKSPVLALLKAASEGDEVLFFNALQRWGINENQLLVTWAIEVSTGQWRSFNRDETFGLGKDRRTADRILRALRTGARPKIAAKLALYDIMEARR